MLLEFSSMFITRIATYSGWTSKPSPRSDTARLRSNVSKGLGNDDVFLSACIVMIFNMMVVKHKKALKTQLTTSVKCTPLALAIFCKGPWSVFSFKYNNAKELHCFGGIIRFRMRLAFQLPPLNETFYTVLSFSSCVELLRNSARRDWCWK